MTHMLGHTGMDVSWVRTVKGQGHRVRKIGGCSLALCSLEYLSSFVLCIIRMVDYTSLVQVWNACHEYCAKHYEVRVAKVAGALYVVMKLIALSCLLAFSN